MARKVIIIGNREFKFQKDALEFFREMLNKYRVNKTIEGEDHEILLSLIERHPEAVPKIGAGISRFYKAPTEKGTSCFWLERIDKSKTDFSYIYSVNAKGKSLYQEFADACRNCVNADLVKTKEAFYKNNADYEGKVECEISGKKIAIYESHLDHKKPITFQVIINTFIAANKIKIVKEMLTFSQDEQYQTEFVDLELKENFRKYHHSIANLRVINSKSNLSLGGSERITKSKTPITIVQQ